MPKFSGKIVVCESFKTDKGRTGYSLRIAVPWSPIPAKAFYFGEGVPAVGMDVICRVSLNREDKFVVSVSI